MIIKRDLCLCGDKQKPKQTIDQFKTIICENCLEVISYKKAEKKKKTKKDKTADCFLLIEEIEKIIYENSFHAYEDGKRKFVVNHKILTTELTILKSKYK